MYIYFINVQILTKLTNPSFLNKIQIATYLASSINNEFPASSLV